MTQSLLLRHGVPAARAITTVESLVLKLQNIRSIQDFGAKTNNYTHWLQNAEGQLRSILVGDELWQSIWSERYWRIHASPGNPPRVVWLHSEIDHQVERLRELANRLESAAAPWTQLEKHTVLVVDTNILVHYMALDKIPWERLLKGDLAIVIPLVVVDEIDRLANRSSGVSDQATAALRALRELRGDVEVPHKAVSVRDKADLYIYVEPSGRPRQPQVDDDILLAASELESFSSASDLRLLTADGGMRFRAQSRGRAVFELDDKYRKRQADE